MQENWGYADWVPMQNDWAPMLEDGVPMQKHTDPLMKVVPETYRGRRFHFYIIFLYVYIPLYKEVWREKFK